MGGVGVGDGVIVGVLAIDDAGLSDGIAGGDTGDTDASAEGEKTGVTAGGVVAFVPALEFWCPSNVQFDVPLMRDDVALLCD